MDSWNDSSTDAETETCIASACACVCPFTNEEYPQKNLKFTGVVRPTTFTIDVIVTQKKLE